MDNISFRKHLDVPDKTTSININMLGKEYFNQFHSINRQEKTNKVEELSKKLPKKSLIGNSSGEPYYFNIIDLYMTSSYEKEHRFEIFKKEIIDKSHNTTNILDIGIGKAELTKYIAQNFEYITVVDTSSEALLAMPDNYGKYNYNVTKINKSILDYETSKKYDLIVASHTFYHIEDKYRVPEVKKLYKSLASGGKLVIVYNDGMSRDELVSSFGGDSDSFGGFLLKTLSHFGKNSYALQSIEIMNTLTVDAALNLADLILSDANIIAPRNEVISYFNHCCYNGTHYQLETIQNFIFINADDNN